MILVLNCGSQSVKIKVFDKNLFQKKENKVLIFKKKDYSKVLKKELLKVSKEFGEKIDLVGHRIVFGGEDFKKPTKITPFVLKKLEPLNKFAPLHNPFNILGIKTALKIFPKAKHYGVFDTEFFSSLPKNAFLYAIPEKIAKKFKYRRFGFHGLSHEYAGKEAARKIKKDFRKLKIITCHLGGGASITAIKNGKAVDTSMGFTPMEGLVMMTRSGDIDPGIVLDIAKHFSPEKAEEILNSSSGLKGICGKESMLEILEQIKTGNKKAKMALDIFVYRIKKYIGAYFTVLGGCDLLVFTGAIGSGSAKIRRMICKDIPFLRGVKILAIKPNEELQIARKITDK